MNLTYMIHPNNHLTKLDNFTIPNMEQYNKLLSTQISKLRKGLTSATTTTNTQKCSNEEMQRLLSYKQIEQKYISSYLEVLKLLESVEGCCDGKSGTYDYEKENEILDSIEIQMLEFKVNENKLKELKCESTGTSSISGKRNDSVTKIEEDHIENVDVKEVH